MGHRATPVQARGKLYWRNIAASAFIFLTGQALVWAVLVGLVKPG